MKYAGFLIRSARLKRNWSQEGLCRGICTVSYLSKIEQGKAEASEEIISLLLKKMDLSWQESDGAFLDECWELLFSYDIPSLKEKLDGADPEKFLCSSRGVDWLLLWGSCTGEPLDEELEPALDHKQLAIQRSIQHRDEEALRLYPCGYLYVVAGSRSLYWGDSTAALEHLQNAYSLAAQEGYPLVMLYAKMLMGNCYSNQCNLPAMLTHCAVASRLARALGKEEVLDTIRYNIAATQLEAGEYENALSYFQTLPAHDRLTGHKLAICYEKLGRIAEAKTALERSELPCGYEAEDELLILMRSVVQYRLEHPDYLNEGDYGELLLECFARCRDLMPTGYALFHLPWVLDWYEHSRQYKQAYNLLLDFPEWNDSRRV